MMRVNLWWKGALFLEEGAKSIGMRGISVFRCA